MTNIIKIKETVKLNLDEPIACKDKNDSGIVYLLLPQQRHDGYKVEGYNWFNIKHFCWNSCVCWKTKEEAIKSYQTCDMFNVEIEL